MGRFFITVLLQCMLVASSLGPHSQLFNVARRKSGREGMGMRLVHVCWYESRPLSSLYCTESRQQCVILHILHFLVIRRILHMSAYSLTSACYFAGLTTCYWLISPISAYMTLDLNIWHACLLAQGSSLSI